MSASEQETCANCGKVYADHSETTACPNGKFGYKWFPQSIADALTRQANRIKRAQKKLTKMDHKPVHQQPAAYSEMRELACKEKLTAAEAKKENP